jgi:prevent-host-death family protein
MNKPRQRALLYFGAFGTAWALLRDFGIEIQAALLLTSFVAGLLIGLRLSAKANGRYTDHMSKRVTATDAKAKILRLLDDAAAGEEIEITRHGRPVARLVPASGARSLKGSFEGVAMTAVDEEELFSTGEGWNAA